MLKKSTLIMIIAALLTLTIILGIGVYTIFQQQPQNDQQQDGNSQQPLAVWSYTFHRDMARTGYSTSGGPLTNQTLWVHPTQMQIEYSSPAVVDGIAYFGSNDHRVRAVNAATGKQIWSFFAWGPIYSSCAVANEMVYFGASNSIYALDAKSGKKIWNYTTGNRVESSPAVANNMVYICSDDSNVYAFDTATGSKIWSYKTGNEVNGSPTVADEIVYIGSKDHNVYALNATTGAKIWSYTTGNWIESTPSIANGILYIGSNDAKVYAFG